MTRRERPHGVKKVRMRGFPRRVFVRQPSADQPQSTYSIKTFLRTTCSISGRETM